MFYFSYSFSRTRFSIYESRHLQKETNLIFNLLSCFQVKHILQCILRCGHILSEAFFLRTSLAHPEFLIRTRDRFLLKLPWKPVFHVLHFVMKLRTSQCDFLHVRGRVFFLFVCLFFDQFNVPFKIISLIETSQLVGGAKREYPGKTT